jgi:lysophospholipid acyltransferase (LPLAT)-like uncharacterized protein
MAIRSPWITGAVVNICVTLGRQWFRSLRVHVVCAQAEDDPRTRDSSSILSIWHEDLMAGCLSFAPHGLQVLVSQSRDGDMVTRTIEGLGFSTIRGSSKRGGARAMLHMLQQIQQTSLAITPDGPKGPRREVKDGVLYLASRSGMPIVPMGVAYGMAYRFRSWDRLAWPCYFSTVVIYMMPSLYLPPNAEKDGLSPYRDQLQASMREASRRAEACLADRSYREFPRANRAVTKQPRVVDRAA